MDEPVTPPAVARLATARGFLALALPLAAGFGVNWVMQFTNRLFLSWYSPDALAASLPAGMVVYCVQALFTVSVGYVGAFAAQHVGAGEPREAGAMAWPMLWLAALAGLLGLLVVPFCGGLFALMGAAPEVTAGMTTLGAWYFAETLPAVAFSGLCGWFGGLGRTRLVLLLSLLVCVLSVALNRWLIFGGLGVPALGLHGAGLATLLATAVGTGIAGALFFGPRMRREYGTWSGRNASPQRLWRFVRSAVPRGATEMLEMLGMVLFTAAIAHLGSAELAANNLVFSLYLLVMLPFVGLGQGVTIAVGQALGAGRPDIARGIVRTSGVLVLTVLGAAAVLFAVAPRLLMACYVPSDLTDPAEVARWARIVELGVPLMWLSAAMFLADGANIVWRFAVQGAGDTRWPLVALTLAALVVLGVPAQLIAHLPDTTWRAWGVAPLTGCWILFTGYLYFIAGLMAWRYLRGPWSRMSLRH